MAPLRSVACLVAVSAGTFCGAFVAPGPAPRMSRHTARTTTTTATRAAALSRRPSPIVLQSKKATPRSSSRALLSTRRSVDTVSREAGGRGGEGGAAPRDAFRSSTKEERQRQQRPAGALEAVPGAGGGEVEEEEGRDLTGLRRTVLLGVWLCFVAYAFGPWSPGASGDPKDIELVTHLYDTLTPEKAIFYNIFNALGVYPAVMVSLLCGGGAFLKGRQPVPPQPFVFGAFALGFFSVGPYLALRNYLPKGEGGVEGGEEMTPVEKAFTGKITAVLLLAGACYFVGNFLLALTDPAAVAGYAELFSTSKLAHISSLDAAVLSVAIVDPLREDMVRRGWEPEAVKVALFAVPLVGPALWLLVRPAVVKD